MSSLNTASVVIVNITLAEIMTISRPDLTKYLLLEQGHLFNS